jgi:hypothetical protein
LVVDGLLRDNSFQIRVADGMLHDNIFQICPLYIVSCGNNPFEWQSLYLIHPGEPVDTPFRGGDTPQQGNNAVN